MSGCVTGFRWEVRSATGLRPLSGRLGKLSTGRYRGCGRLSGTPGVHPPAQVDAMAAAIRQWGWTMPILADEHGQIIAGHCRVLAAQQMGLIEVPVIVARGWSEEQKRAYVIADNRLPEGGRWDDALLSIELGDLADAGFDVSLTGMSAEDVRRLTGDGGEEGGGLEVREIATTAVKDEFWISVRGPLAHQADALLRLRELMAEMDGVSIELGTIGLEP